MINLTATLTTKTVHEVMRHLGMKQENTFMVQKSPLNENTHLTIMEKGKQFNLLASLLNFLHEIEDDESSNDRVIIFCTTLEDCGKIHRDIAHSSFKNELLPLTRVKITFRYITFNSIR